MTNLSNILVTILNPEIYLISACKYCVSLKQTEKTVYNTKFTLLEGPKSYVLNFIFREISPKFEKSLKLQLK